ncbi:phosphatidylinositol-3,5-bisphosphate 5-phosphatase [Saxophila tyrrhenica]|uniref:Phosphatidylinositol-3,5-bisphosphate 5-phosphatase n=1 Tax=Saxophila tyrrhenica TaxID=1690608 RepID=A0AAV9NZH1_9PEZI|nr:phosphatidylinositol-3,5-bisphosphate 5-phosphatase [Saxophila tyrrhenica]
MDSGPVDAAPYAHTDYDDPIQPPSPEQERLEKPRKHAFRSTSTRRSAGDDLRRTMSELSVNGTLDGAAAEQATNADAGPPEDTPQYPRVGATDEQVKEAVADEDENPEIKAPSRDRSSEATPREPSLHRIYKLTLYETNARYWITGADIADKQFRMLRIDRTSAPGQIALFEDDTTYDRRQMNEVLASIDEGNKSTGGLRMKCTFWGLLGFIRFTEAYYMLIVTQRKQVAMIGGHYVYQVEGTELVPLTTGASSRFVRDRNPEETRFLNVLNNLDLSKSFYFSYSYDITHSLQHNIIRQRQAMNEGQHQADQAFNSMFVWNHHLLKPAISALKHPFNWCLPIIHGFIDQAALDIFGRAVYITIVGRRSRHFAGARFLKRGVNDLGYVANDVETEQIVSEKLTTSFHAPGPRLYSSPTYTSFLHHRGSIPLYWTQDNSGVTPKPAIDLNLQDPFYQPAALHFDNLFGRYGCPVSVLNLIKSRERTPRESKLLVEFEKCIDYLNQSLPEGKKIMYKAFDMSRASKTRGGDVIGSLEVIAKEIVAQTGFFRNGDEGFDEPVVQNGIVRTNCIDCLDRTNAAQFVIGKRAFALQLQALGVIDRDEVDFDTDAVNVFTHMFHDHGDTIAVQYGGSHLVNTMATYRKLNQWQSSSRDMVESFKRYYHNSFLDSQRQEAYNLFLGNYVWAQGQPLLWDLPTDYYLHHGDPKAWLERKRRNYIYWFTPEHLDTRTLPPTLHLLRDKPEAKDDIRTYDDYWLECYRPAALSTLGKVYSYRLNSSNKFLPDRPQRDSRSDFSPFKTRLDPQRAAHDATEKKAQRRVKIADGDPTDSPRPPTESAHSPPATTTNNEKPSILREPTTDRHYHPSPPPQPSTELGGGGAAVKPADKAQMHLWTLNQFHLQSLHPSVSPSETAEYTRYISHPLHLPLVVSTELPSDANLDYVEYVHKPGGSARDDFEDADEAGLLGQGVGEADLAAYAEFVGEREGLTVGEEDGGTKRYKAYRQWLRGKSLFKQSKVDPEYKGG